MDGGRDVVIDRNTVDSCDIAFEIASQHGGMSTSNITIVSNTIFYGNDGEVVLQYNCNGITLKNNILYPASVVEYQGDTATFCPKARYAKMSWLKKKLDLGAYRLACNDGMSGSTIAYKWGVLEYSEAIADRNGP